MRSDECRALSARPLLQDALRSSFNEELRTARESNAEVDKFAEKAVDDLNPARVLRLFQKILALDMPLLDIACRPEHLLITCIAVPPVCIRPSVEMDSGAGSNEDDATTRLLAVCDMSISIRKNLDMGIASWETIMEQWDFLQVGHPPVVPDAPDSAPAPGLSCPPFQRSCVEVSAVQHCAKHRCSRQLVAIDLHQALTPHTELRATSISAM